DTCEIANAAPSTHEVSRLHVPVPARFEAYPLPYQCAARFPRFMNDLDSGSAKGEASSGQIQSRTLGLTSLACGRDKLFRSDDPIRAGSHGRGNRWR